MGIVVTINRKFTVIRKIKHYLFECPTFWILKPRFKCPICGNRFRCYFDGNDIGGKIDVCNKCAEEYERLGAWNETNE